MTFLSNNCTIWHHNSKIWCQNSSTMMVDNIEIYCLANMVFWVSIHLYWRSCDHELTNQLLSIYIWHVIKCFIFIHHSSETFQYVLQNVYKYWKWSNLYLVKCSQCQWNHIRRYYYNIKFPFGLCESWLVNLGHVTISTFSLQNIKVSYTVHMQYCFS